MLLVADVDLIVPPSGAWLLDDASELLDDASELLDAWQWLGAWPAYDALELLDDASELLDASSLPDALLVYAFFVWLPLRFSSCS